MMDFKDFLPEEKSDSENKMVLEKNLEQNENSKIGQNQFFGIITSRKPDWQTIIYDLIHTEQLDPWDIDIIVLTSKYFEKIIEMEESEIDFYISSRVLLAASLLLRIKSEFLLNKYMRSIDEILFGKKEDIKQIIERIEIDEEELPILIPKTPLPRARRVTLPELMAALNKAINTESRRIKREVAVKRAHQLSQVDIPKFRRIYLKDRIKQFYARILTGLKKQEIKKINKIGFHELIGNEKEEKLASFLPVLHLSNTQKIWLEQENHLDEIWIYLYDYFDKNRDKFVEELEEDIEEWMESSEQSSESKNSAEQGSIIYEHVEGEKLSPYERVMINKEKKRKLSEEIAKELEEELGIIAKDRQIEDISGFSDE